MNASLHTYRGQVVAQLRDVHMKAAADISRAYAEDLATRSWQADITAAWHHAEATYTEAQVVDALVLAVGIALLGWLIYRLRVPMLVVFGMWFMWLLWRVCIMRDPKAWPHIEHAAAAAQTSAREAVINVCKMLQELFILFFPFFHDGWQNLVPVLHDVRDYLLKLWSSLSQRDQSLVIVVIFAVMLSVILMVLLWRHCATVGSVLFQLSFLVICPVVYYVVLEMQPDNAAVLLSFFMTGVPVMGSIWAIQQRQEERERYRRLLGAGSGHTGEGHMTGLQGFLFAVSAAPSPKASERVQEKLRSWLSFCAFWPLFDLAKKAAEVLPGGFARPPVYAGLLCAVLWTQFWHGSRAALVFLQCLTTATSSTYTRQVLSDASDTVASSVSGSMSYMAGLATAWAQFLPGEQVTMGIAVVVALSLLLSTMSLVDSFLDFCILFGVAVDSARLAVEGDADACSSRLAFWIIALSWMWLLTLPLLRTFFGLWTPLVLAAAASFGEWTLSVTVVPYLAAWSTDIREQFGGMAPRPGFSAAAQWRAAGLRAATQVQSPGSTTSEAGRNTSLEFDGLELQDIADSSQRASAQLA
eukprot:TRINITY_DN4686_c0_g2_i1.p1 TRINITY_DN4686_c0_g2~~TRINITY_DN4686_c0_g2_i1.p1  ORF type:complete len:584 (-),score=93.37 TRINITY_DN4686_c0_g2_i1:46-1797(-)